MAAKPTHDVEDSERYNNAHIQAHFYSIYLFPAYKNDMHPKIYNNTSKIPLSIISAALQVFTQLSRTH